MREWDWISFLATGPEKNLMAFQYAAMFAVELFDRRAQTVRCRAHGDDKGKAAFELAIELAKKHEVTVEELQGAGDDERHVLRWLAPHGRKWNDGKRWSKKERTP